MSAFRISLMAGLLGNEGYVEAVRKSVAGAAAEGFLLRPDGDALIKAAQASEEDRSRKHPALCSIQYWVHSGLSPLSVQTAEPIQRQGYQASQELPTLRDGPGAAR